MIQAHEVPLLLLLPLLSLPVWGCGSQSKSAPPLEVLSVFPAPPAEAASWGSIEKPVPLYLNSEVRIIFSDALDPLTVTPDTVRMVKIVPGHRPLLVKRTRLRPRTRFVSITPEPPLTAHLTDGSYEPDQLYRLEVLGFPLLNSITSRAGTRLKEGYVRYFKTVSQDAKDPGPLLAPGVGSEPLLHDRRFLRATQGSKRLHLHFTLPLFPPLVSPKSFRVYPLRGGDARIVDTLPEIEITAVRLLSDPRDPYPGCTVELQLEKPVPAVLWVDLRPWSRLGSPTARDRANWVRDYQGRFMAETPDLPSLLRVPVSPPGTGRQLLQFGGDRDKEDALRFRPESVGLPSFEFRDGWIKPWVRREAGDGSLGIFHPKASMTLEPGVAFDRGDGVMVKASQEFHFRSIRIPRGVVVRVLSKTPLRILSCSEIVVEGSLELDPPPERLPPSILAPGGPGLDDILDRAGIYLLAAEDLRVDGQIRQRRPDRSTLVLRAGGAIRLLGTIPRQTVLVATGIQGLSRSPFWKLPLQPGLPAGVRVTAAAWTPWRRLPDYNLGKIDARAVELTGDLSVFMQVVEPDPIDPSQPYLPASGLPEPLALPLKAPLDVAPGSHVRFLLRARVLGGEKLPSVRSLLVLAE